LGEDGTYQFMSNRAPILLRYAVNAGQAGLSLPIVNTRLNVLSRKNAKSGVHALPRTHVATTHVATAHEVGDVGDYLRTGTAWMCISESSNYSRVLL